MPDPDDTDKSGSTGGSKPLNPDAPAFVPGGLDTVQAKFLNTAGLTGASSSTDGADTTGSPKPPEPAKPSAETTKVTGLTADEKATKAIHDGFKTAAADSAFVKAATAKLGEVTAKVKTLGRTPPTDATALATWEAEAKKIRASRAETDALRADLKTELAKPDLDADLRKELEAMKDAVDSALLEIIDLEPAHGPTNHCKPTRDAIGKRALINLNPRTGGIGGGATRATRIPDKADYLDAVTAGRSNDAFEANKPAADSGRDYFSFELPLADALGPDALTKIEGLTYVGSGSKRTQLATAMKNGQDAAAKTLIEDHGLGVSPTNLAGGTMYYGFSLEDGEWILNSMYPQVAPVDDGHGNMVAPARPGSPDLVFDPTSDEWTKEDTDGTWKAFDIAKNEFK